MSSITDFNLSPEIIVGEEEHRRLLLLAMTGLDHSADDADDLMNELDRASIRPDNALPRDTVRMGSTVVYRTHKGEVRQVQLVYPGQADISSGAVSILTPIGTALIGLRTGQSITWRGRDGHRNVLTIVRVVDGAPGPGPNGNEAA